MKSFRIIFALIFSIMLFSCSAKETKAIHFGPGPDDKETIQEEIECSNEEVSDHETEKF